MTEPHLAIEAQYLKDLSFENPNAPMSFAPDSQPEIGVEVKIDAAGSKERPESFEVALHIKAHAKSKQDTLFLAEILYCGIFTIKNAPENLLQPLLFIECPRLLFPYARAIISSVTTDSGFPPLVLAPVNFAELYVQQLQKSQQDS